MGADKVRHVRQTGAEVLVAADNSCLTHIGGLLGRDRAGVATMHIAEVLAATERPAATSRAQKPAQSARARGMPA
jgi:L-lactate dehydrogenase complex protein LldE